MPNSDNPKEVGIFFDRPFAYQVEVGKEFDPKVPVLAEGSPPPTIAPQAVEIPDVPTMDLPKNDEVLKCKICGKIFNIGTTKATEKSAMTRMKHHLQKDHPTELAKGKIE